MIKNNLWSLVFTVLVLFPAAMWLLGGEPFPQAPATEKVDARYSAVTSVPPRSYTTALPAPARAPVSGSPELPGPCKVSECEGEAEKALPGREWRAYLTLESLRRELEEACHYSDTPRVANIAAKAQRYSAPFRGICRDRSVDADYRATFCDPWQC